MKEITEIKEIQKIAFEILKFVDKFCRKHNIKYSICGGTLLGAVRHKGFIPWDDDIDIMMPREEYERFLKLMDNQYKNGDKYKCLHYGKNFPDYYYRFAKVVDLSTTLQESTFINNKELGIFIDVFPLDGIPSNHPLRYAKKSHYYGRMLIHSNMSKVNKNGIPIGKYLIKKYLLYPFAKLYGRDYWLKKHENYVKSFHFNDYEYCNLYAGGIGINEMFPRKFFDEIIDIDFEGYKLQTIKEYEKYLEHAYGDYMTPPPPEKQITHHEFKIYKK
ncbi:MAG: LicD family protein [Firmicutes bacterium]|nr:LicD family protein [Bacillota bacterium]